MGDFLSNLVTRSSVESAGATVAGAAVAGAAVAAVRPRPVSIYEAGTDAQAGSPELLAVDEPARGGRAAPVTDASQANAPAQPAPRERKGFLDGADLSWLETWRKRMDAQATAAPAPAAAAAAPQPSGESPRMAALPPGTIKEIPQPALQREPAVRAVEAHSPVTRGQIAPRIEAGISRAQMGEGAHSAVKDGTPEREKPSQGLPAQPHETATGVRPAPLPGLPEEHSEPRAPTIQVSIGRIEVRMTPAPGAGKSESQAAPVMRLEDYLRLRNGGQR